ERELRPVRHRANGALAGDGDRVPLEAGGTGSAARAGDERDEDGCECGERAHSLSIRRRPDAASHGTGLRPVPYAATSEGSRYCRQLVGSPDGAASRMKSTGAGGRGARRRIIDASSGRRSPFFRLHGAHAVTTFSQTESPPRLRGTTWSSVRRPPLVPQ